MKPLFKRKQEIPAGKKPCEDNTLQELAEKTLKKHKHECVMLNLWLDTTEMRLRTLVENIPHCVARFDTKGRFLYVNPAVTNTFGFPSTHFKGKTLTELNLSSKPGQDQILHDMILMVVNSGKPNHTETGWMTKNSVRFFDVQLIPEKDKNGNVISVLSIAEDITERKNYEKELKEARNRLSAIVSTLPDLVWLKNTNGMYTICNKAYEEYFGASESEIIGKTDRDFFDDEIAYEMQEEDIETINRGRMVFKSLPLKEAVFITFGFSSLFFFFLMLNISLYYFFIYTN